LKRLLLTLIILSVIGGASAHSFTVPEWNQNTSEKVAPANKYLETDAGVEKTYQGMLVLGAEHILDKNASLFNIPTPFLNDHGYLLFGILLMPGYLLSRNLKNYRNLVEMASAFALGHLIAVMTTYFNLIQIPGFLVESGIAFSIALIGIERLAILEGKLKDSRKRIVGLLLLTGFWHGNGFAAVMNAVNFSSTLKGVAMISTFSLGVDLGQLLFMLFLGTVLYLAMRKAGEEKTVRIGSYLLVAVGMSLTVFRFLPVVGGLL